MPQMSPLFWLGLLFFFLMILVLFLMLTHSVKPFKIFTQPAANYILLKSSWKL
uniref:ATP synthase F0 subunit 8 n=1 Tax=Tenuipotamon yuxiense TaxID=2682933 RepID=A0A650F341_9EUCA|nr:ATP synthase F0 subunit 8 [Tenuipotamon yuxiense]